MDDLENESLVEKQDNESLESNFHKVLPPPAYDDTVHVVNQTKQDLQQLKFQRRRRCLLLGMAATFASMAVTLVVLGAWILALRAPSRSRSYHGECEILFPDDSNVPFGLPHRMREDVEMDQSYARIRQLGRKDSPLIQEETTILHLLDKKVSIIKKHDACYVKPLRPQLLSMKLNDHLYRQLQEPGRAPIEAHLRREHWFISRTPILPAFFSFEYGYRAMELCDKLTVLRLITRTEYEEGARSTEIQRIPVLSSPHRICVEKQCVDEECPSGYVRELNVHGCLLNCGCMPTPSLSKGVVLRGVLCPVLGTENCPLQCPWGFERDVKYGCEVCLCAQPPHNKQDHLGRQRRSLDESEQHVPSDLNGATCPVIETVFEGVVVGDTSGVAPVDYLHSCGL